MKTEKSKFIDHLIENGDITLNPELDKYDNISLFPKKVKKAKEIIAKGNLPKPYYEQIDKKNKK